MDELKLPQNLKLNDEVLFFSIGCTCYEKICKPVSNGFIRIGHNVYEGRINL